MIYLITNGSGRRPHVEEVETLEDVQARLEIEDDPDDVVVIDGEMIQHQREEFLFIADQTIKIEHTDDKGLETSSDGLPDWIQAFREGADERAEDVDAAGAAREAEHLSDVEGHPAGEANEAPGDSSGEGPDEAGAGAGG